MNEVYIISDVHGCIKTLLALIKKLPTNSKLVFVGDLIDRGNSSKDVIEFVKTNNYDCVLGNHELFMKNSLLNIDNNSYHWIYFLGGDKTLKSYHNDINILAEHLKWINKLPLYLEYEDLKTANNRNLVVSHSCVNDKWKFKNLKKSSLSYQSFKKEILYSRNIGEFDNKDIFNVFGHTPLSYVKKTSSYAAIDLGCVYENQKDIKGYLCAFAFPSMKIIKQRNIE